MAGLIPQSYRRDTDYQRPPDWHQRLADGRAREAAMAAGLRRGCRPLDVDALIKRFGGPTQTARRLQRRGLQVTVKTVQKWRERGRVSSDWLGELALMAAEERRPLRLEDYVVGAPHRVARKTKKPKSLLD